MKNWKLVLGVLCLVVVLLIAGCGKKSPSTKPKPDPEPGDKEVQIFLETFDKIETPTNIKEDQSLLDNPDSFDPGNISVDYLWAGREKGALSMDNGTETEPGPNAPRVAILVPELDKATKPVLKVTAKNTSGNEIYLYVGNKYIASGNLGEDGHRAHDVCTISANSPYKVYTIPLNEAWLASNLIQLRPTIIGQDGKNTSNGAAGLVIDQIEIVAESTTAKLNYELVVTTIGEGSVSPDGGTFEAGTTVTLTATPSDGWIFKSWSGDIGDANPNESTINITMYGDKTITAEFVGASTKHSLTVNVNDSNMGSVTITQQKDEYDPGDIVTLHAEANDGYVFKQWTGDQTGYTNPVEITMNRDKTITAEFEVVGGGIPFSEDFDEATSGTFFTAEYKSLPNYPDKPMYRVAGGASNIAFIDGYIRLGNGSRFVIGEKDPADTASGVKPNGDLDLSKPYKISFKIIDGTGVGNFQVYVDNNGTSSGNSYHGGASRVYSTSVAKLVAGTTIEITSSVGTTNSFIQLRSESNAAIAIDDLTIVYID